jgi:hypothetical protein
MNTFRNCALGAGILFVIADIAGILSVTFSKPLLDNPDYLIKVSESPNSLVMAALLIVIMEIACSGIAIWLYPVLQKQNKALALWSVGFRLIECVFGLVSVLGLLAILSLSQEFIKAGTPDGSYFQTMGTMIKSVRSYSTDFIMLFGWGMGALLYNYIFFQTNLVPRWLSSWGIVAILLHMISCLLVVFNIISPDFSLIQITLLLPSALQEIFLAFWLIIKRFNPIAIASLIAKTKPVELIHTS